MDTCESTHFDQFDIFHQIRLDAVQFSISDGELRQEHLQLIVTLELVIFQSRYSLLNLIRQQMTDFADVHA